MPPDLSFKPSANIAQLKESATIAVSQRARALKAAGREIIDLGAGEKPVLHVFSKIDALPADQLVNGERLLSACIVHGYCRA